VAEQELDLFEFAAGGAAELGAGAAQVMGLELQSQFPAVEPDRGEHGLRRERRAGDTAVPVERAQQAAPADRSQNFVVSWNQQLAFDVGAFAETA
jgi:hypothetical protein